MTAQQPRYWFHAKRYGWGWGLPATWEGWAVLLGAIAVILVSGLVLPLAASLLISGIAVVVILWAGFAHGPPPRWRWGSRD